MTVLRPDMKGRKPLATKNEDGISTTCINIGAGMTGTKNRAANDTGGKNEDAELLRYFWMCNGGAQNDGKGCGYFRVMDMKGEGRGEFFSASTSRAADADATASGSGAGSR